MTTLTVEIYPPGLYGGVYSYQEAARLLGVTAQRVMRWADGYTFPRKGGLGESGPILQTERHKGVVSYQELFELFFVREYAALKVPLPHIRATAEVLSRQFGAYPFSTVDLIVSGRELLVKSAVAVLHRADVGQIVADFALGLAKDVEFRDRIASKYFPPGFERAIYLDREIRSGEPVITQHAIPTRAIFSLWERERNLEAVADYHDITVSEVSAAVRYEGQWRLAA
jgi:uncharacterized protein (DUF433 family)